MSITTQFGLENGMQGVIKIQQECDASFNKWSVYIIILVICSWRKIFKLVQYEQGIIFYFLNQGSVYANKCTYLNYFYFHIYIRD